MEKNSKPNEKKPAYYNACGRRKTATASVWLYPLLKDKEVVVGEKTLKSGDILVNDRAIGEYFPGEVAKKIYFEPFRTTNTLDRFAATVKTVGSGPSGQLAAVVHGISRALVKVDPERFKPILRKRGLLTRDPRARERRKPGLAGKARKEKQSPKR